jgi:hypothetical protein
LPLEIFATKVLIPFAESYILPSDAVEIDFDLEKDWPLVTQHFMETLEWMRLPHEYMTFC